MRYLRMYNRADEKSKNKNVARVLRRRAVRVFEELDIGHAVRIPGGVLMGPQLHRGAVLPRKGADTEEIGTVSDRASA